MTLDPDALKAATEAVKVTRMTDAEYTMALQRALTGLTRQGSEFFVQHGDGFRADIPACLRDIQQRREDMHNAYVREIGRRKDAEAKLAALSAHTDHSPPEGEG